VRTASLSAVSIGENGTVNGMKGKQNKKNWNANKEKGAGAGAVKGASRLAVASSIPTKRIETHSERADTQCTRPQHSAVQTQRERHTGYGRRGEERKRYQINDRIHRTSAISAANRTTAKALRAA
jgi:hypothetical protein